MVHRAWATATDPEAKARLQGIRATLTIREVRGYSNITKKTPTARYDLGWPEEDDDRYVWATRLGWWHPEFHSALWEWKVIQYMGTDYAYSYRTVPTENDERCRTIQALIRYVSRTDDWDTVRRILK